MSTDTDHPTFQQMQGDTPRVLLDGELLAEDAYETLADPDGCRVSVSWDAIENGYVSPGWTCEDCGASFERWRDGQKHGRDEHGETPANLRQVFALVNSAAVDWTGDNLAVTISTGDPRGAFVMSVRRMPDGRRILTVPHPADPLPHEDLYELHPGTYEIGRTQPREFGDVVAGIVYETLTARGMAEEHARAAVEQFYDYDGFGRLIDHVEDAYVSEHPEASYEQ